MGIYARRKESCSDFNEFFQAVQSHPAGQGFCQTSSQAGGFGGGGGLESGAGVGGLLSCLYRHPQLIFQYRPDVLLVIKADPTVPVLANFNVQWFRYGYIDGVDEDQPPMR